jgi:Xaa-Pro aminopeptidase
VSSTITRESKLDTLALLGAKTDQAVEILREKGIDVWLTYVRESTANVDPALELIFDGDLTWESALILTADGEKIAIVGVHDAPDLEEAGIFGRVIGYREGITEPLVNTLSRLDPHDIAINLSENDSLADGLGAGLHRLLVRRLENTIYQDRLVPAEDVIWSLRGRKLPQEVEAIRRALEETEKVFQVTQENIRPGVTACALADSMREYLALHRLGCAWTPKICPIVSAGSGSKVGHVSPGEETIERGSLVHIDFGVRLDGYCTDLQRMWYVSKDGEGPSEPVTHAFSTIVDAITKSAEALKPGVPGWEIDEIARAAVVEAGYEEYQHALGHQVGRLAHDGGGATLAPQWERYNETPFSKVEAGNVFTLEPSIVLPDHGVVALEEMVLVTADGCEFLSQRQMELPSLHFPK